VKYKSTTQLCFEALDTLVESCLKVGGATQRESHFNRTDTSIDGCVYACRALPPLEIVVRGGVGGYKAG